MTTTTSRRHAIEFRHNPDKSEGWPAFPFLPLIRPTEQEAPDDLELGVIIDGHDDLVVLANLVEVTSQAMMAGGVDQPEFLEWLPTADTIVYPDFDAVLDDGWVID